MNHYLGLPEETAASSFSVHYYDCIFELLITVSGVGPKMGLSLLSTLSPDAFRLALANQEPALLARTPGVGKRTAEKIVLELKDKVRGRLPASGRKPAPSPCPSVPARSSAVRCRRPCAAGAGSWWPAPGASVGAERAEQAQAHLRPDAAHRDQQFDLIVCFSLGVMSCNHSSGQKTTMPPSPPATPNNESLFGVARVWRPRFHLHYYDCIFELLITVSGVGPKMGLSLLSTLSPDAFRLALANQEPALLARTPGVGKRTAEKIVLELKDKVRGRLPASGRKPALHLVLQFQVDRKRRCRRLLRQPQIMNHYLGLPEETAASSFSSTTMIAAHYP